MVQKPGEGHDLDLATANITSDDVSVLLNNGDGTFAADVTYGVGDRPFSVAVGDLDGDLDLDLAVANGIDYNVSVLLNNGDGTFADAVKYAVGDQPRSVAVGDLDGVNGPDLAVGNALSNDVSVLLNLCTSEACPWDLTGDGTVGVGDLLQLFANWGTPGPGDFNNDGIVGVGDMLLMFANWGPCP